jgi:hypothetical protein
VQKFGALFRIALSAKKGAGVLEHRPARQDGLAHIGGEVAANDAEVRVGDAEASETSR